MHIIIHVLRNDSLATHTNAVACASYKQRECVDESDKDDDDDDDDDDEKSGVAFFFVDLDYNTDVIIATLQTDEPTVEVGEIAIPYQGLSSRRRTTFSHSPLYLAFIRLFIYLFIIFFTYL